MRELSIEATRPNYLSEIFRSTGSSMLWLMILLVMGGLYLAVSAKTAQLGRDVIGITEDVRQKTLIRNEKAAHFAEITSPTILRPIAESKGYHDASLSEIVYTYVDVPSVTITFTAPPPDTLVRDRNQLLSPAYTETLIDGFRRWLGVEEVE